MSATKRYIEDKCEEIGVTVGLAPDIVLDIFNIVNKYHPFKDDASEEEKWEVVKEECRKYVAFFNHNGFGTATIQTGYIPVEYNHYKELIQKAEAYDNLADTIMTEHASYKDDEFFEECDNPFDAFFNILTIREY